MRQTLTVSAADQTAELAQLLQPFYKDRNVFCFYGDLGAGKTTYIKSLCRELGVTSGTSSPTFSIVNEYVTEQGQRIFHFDLYRLNDPMELIDIGWYDYLNAEAILFIEWPEMAGTLIPEDAVHVHIEQQPDESRQIKIIDTL